VKNQFGKALKAKKARLAQKQSARPGKLAGVEAERAEERKNRKFLSSTRADKK